jgi:hypothetical protein
MDKVAIKSRDDPAENRSIAVPGESGWRKRDMIMAFLPVRITTAAILDKAQAFATAVGWLDLGGAGMA